MCGSLSVFCAASCTMLRVLRAVAPLGLLLHHLGPSVPCFSRRVGGLSGAGNA